MEYLSPLGLDVLRTAIELGSFRAAAQQLNISQPAVSAHIHRIEQCLRIQLFERPYRRNLRPTDAGYLLYQHAIEVSAKNKEVLKLLHEITNGECGEVSFATSLCKFLFCSLVALYIKQYPDVRVDFRAGNSMQVTKLVRYAEVDFGLSLYEDDSELTYLPFHRDPMELICAHNHPLARKGVISKDDLTNYRLITCLDGSAYNHLINNYLATLGINRARSTVHVEDGTMLLQLVEKGGGIGILSRSTTESAFHQGRIAKLFLSDGRELPNIESHLVFRNNTKLNRAVQAFLKFLVDEIPKQFPFVTMTNKAPL